MLPQKPAFCGPPDRYRVCGGGGKGDGEFICGGGGNTLSCAGACSGAAIDGWVGPDIARLRRGRFGSGDDLARPRLDDLAWRGRRHRLERRYNRVGHQIRRRAAEQRTWRLVDGKLNCLGYVAIQRECHRLGCHRHRKRTRRRTGLALCGLNVRTGRHGLKLKDLGRRRRRLEQIRRARTRASCQCSAHSDRGGGEQPNTQHNALPVPRVSLGPSGNWVKRIGTFGPAIRLLARGNAARPQQRRAGKKWWSYNDLSATCSRQGESWRAPGRSSAVKVNESFARVWPHDHTREAIGGRLRSREWPPADRQTSQ